MSKSIQAIIIDDEEKLTDVLKIKIEKFLPQIEVLGCATNVTQAYQLISELNPNLVFLDISMPGESGFSLLEKFDPVPFEVIFVTGYSEFALDAFKVSAVDYLLKPVKTEELIESVKKVTAVIEKNEISDKYKLLKYNVENIGNQESKIVIPGTELYEFIYVKDIIRCEGVQKYTYIHLINQTKILSSYNIGHYKDLLKNYSFFSTHKSHLINTNHIKRYLTEGTVVMRDDSSAPVSRRRKEIFSNTIIKGRT